MANSSLALDHDARGGGDAMDLTQTPTPGGGMGSHPPAVGEGRWEPLPQETGLRRARIVSSECSSATTIVQFLRPA